MKSIASVVTEESQRNCPAEAGNILRGVKKISEYMRELGFDVTIRRCFDWIAAGRIPHTKAGVQIVSSKSAIRERFLEAIK